MNESHPCFSLYAVPQNGRTFYLVNGGFPVNFNGQVDPIGAAEIQLTRGLLFLGAVQAGCEQAPGLIALDGERQTWLWDSYRQLMGRRLDH